MHDHYFINSVQPKHKHKALTLIQINNIYHSQSMVGIHRTSGSKRFCINWNQMNMFEKKRVILYGTYPPAIK